MELIKYLFNNLALGEKDTMSYKEFITHQILFLLIFLPPSNGKESVECFVEVKVMSGECFLLPIATMFEFNNFSKIVWKGFESKSAFLGFWDRMFEKKELGWFSIEVWRFWLLNTPDFYKRFLRVL